MEWLSLIVHDVIWWNYNLIPFERERGRLISGGGGCQHLCLLFLTLRLRSCDNMEQNQAKKVAKYGWQQFRIFLSNKISLSPIPLRLVIHLPKLNCRGSKRPTNQAIISEKPHCPTNYQKWGRRLSMTRHISHTDGRVWWNSTKFRSVLCNGYWRPHWQGYRNIPIGGHRSRKNND
jgi:hypothetical protein